MTLTVQVTKKLMNLLLTISKKYTNNGVLGIINKLSMGDYYWYMEWKQDNLLHITLIYLVYFHRQTNVRRVDIF